MKSKPNDLWCKCFVSLSFFSFAYSHNIGIDEENPLIEITFFPTCERSFEKFSLDYRFCAHIFFFSSQKDFKIVFEENVFFSVRFFHRQHFAVWIFPCNDIFWQEHHLLCFTHSRFLTKLSFRSFFFSISTSFKYSSMIWRKKKDWKLWLSMLNRSVTNKAMNE